jgi:hypothetical protein
VAILETGSNREGAKARRYFERRCERLVNGAPIGDRQESSLLFGGQRTIQLNDAVNMVESYGFLIAIQAITDVIARVSELNRDPLERPLLQPGVQPQCDRGAGAKCHQQEFIGTRSCIVTSRSDRFVGQQPMSAVEQSLCQAMARFHNNNRTGFRYRLNARDAV